MLERFGPGAIEHDVRRFFHDQPSQTDWIFHMFHTGDRAGLECFTLHDRSVHFVRASACEIRAFAGIKMPIVFEHAHSGFRSVET